MQICQHLFGPSIRVMNNHFRTVLSYLWKEVTSKVESHYTRVKLEGWKDRMWTVIWIIRSSGYQETWFRTTGPMTVEIGLKCPIKSIIDYFWVIYRLVLPRTVNSNRSGVTSLDFRPDQLWYRWLKVTGYEGIMNKIMGNWLWKFSGMDNYKYFMQFLR